MTDRDLLIQRIYEAAVSPQMWPRVLEDLGNAAGTPGLVLLTRRSDAWTGFSVSKSLEQDFLQYLATDIVSRSATTPRLLAKDRAGFLSNDDLFSPAEWEQEPFRKEWGRKWGWNHAAASAIHVPSGDFLVFHAQRRDGEPSFSARDIAALDSYRPHLARSGLLAARWRLQQLRAATEALAMVGLPAAILDQDCRALAANTLIEKMTSHVQWMARDRIKLIDAQAHTLLVQAVQELPMPRHRHAYSFAARAQTEQAVVAHVVPTTGQARDLFGGGLALLVLTPVTAPEAPDLALVRGLFDLSPGEARVAGALTRGQRLKDIAAASGTSVETVRSQVKAVMAKTGTGRQSDIAALLASLPRLKP